MTDTDVRWWMIDPVGHRQHEQANVPKEMEFLGQQVPVIHTPAPLDFWVCDFCNADIPITIPSTEELERMRRESTDPDEEVEVEHLMIPMLDSRALCPSCVAEHPPTPLTFSAKMSDLRDGDDWTPLGAWKAAWAKWGKESMRVALVQAWSPQGCGCPPCKKAAMEMLEREGARS